MPVPDPPERAVETDVQEYGDDEVQGDTDYRRSTNPALRLSSPCSVRQLLEK